MNAAADRAPVVSVVVIGRNEAGFIEACLRHARGAAREAGLAAEIIYVDSASTDATVGLATPLADRILTRASDWPPFAGRLLGLRAAQGEFVQFLDADMELEPVWFVQAFAMMRDGKLDALCGSLLAPDAQPASDASAARPHWHLLAADRLEAADNGATLFLRSSLLRIGGHHPGLVGMDNSEVLIRACAAGLQVARTETPCARHMRTRPRESLPARIGRMMRHEYPGTGQALRLSFRGPPAYRNALQEKLGIPMAILLWALALPWLSVFRVVPWMGLATGTAAMVALAVLVQSTRKRSLAAGARSVVDSAGNAVGLLVGVLLPLPEPAEYAEQVLAAPRRSDAGAAPEPSAAPSS